MVETDAELAEHLEALRYQSRSINSKKWEQDRAERQLEALMVKHAKRIIRALQHSSEVHGPK